MGCDTDLKPIVSKVFCSASETKFMVRKRPLIMNGGGFVVTSSSQKLAFTVDGCGILGTKGELIVRDGNGTPTLFICENGGIVQALSFSNRWKGYLMEYEMPTRKLLFSLKEPKSCIAMNNTIRVSIETREKNKDWDYEVRGSFMEKACTINDRSGNIVAQVGAKGMVRSRELYYVVVKAGYDQAFVFGVIAVLDNVHGESTRC